MRKILKSFSIVLLVFTVYGCSDGRSVRALNMPSVENTNTKSVVVVGAGIAGLNAANKLVAAGFKVVVLEARHRVGGRLWSDRSIDGVTLDLGASWIHGINDNPLYTYAKGLGVKMKAWDYDKLSVYDTLGKKSPANYSRAEEVSEIIGEHAFSTYLRNANASIQDVIDRAKKSGDLAAFSDEEVNFYLTTIVELGNAQDVNKLPISALMELEEEESDDVEDTEVVFPHGYDQLTTALAKGLDIRLNTLVTQIDYSQEKVSITANNNKQFTADYVLVTVPLGVLKKKVITFKPELPDDKLHAINTLDMGVLAKVFLTFPSVFWDKDVEQFQIGYTNKEKGQFTTWLNLTHVTGQPVLMAFNAGEYGKEIESLSTEEVKARAMKVLRTLYGDSIPQPTHVKVSRWSTDPYSYGSYSAATLDSTDDMYHDLAENIDDKLFFAGEATSEMASATVHGAFLTGEREANKIIDLQMN